METQCKDVCNSQGYGSTKVLLTNDKEEELRSRLDLENVCMIIVDEVSTIDTKHIAFLDFRLQHTKNIWSWKKEKKF